MSTISFQCYSCGQVLKVGLDKAGKRGKCPKCGTLLTIPVSSTAPEPPAAPAAPPVAVAPPAAEAPAEAQQAVTAPYASPGTALPGPLRAEPVDGPAAAPPQYAPAGAPYVAEEEPRHGAGFPRWERVRLGLLLVFISSCVLAGTVLLELVGHLLLTINVLQTLAGTSQISTSPPWLILYRIAEPVALAAAVAVVAGCVLCLLGPKQRGAQPLALIALSLATLYLLTALIFGLGFLYGDQPSALLHDLTSTRAGGPAQRLEFGTWFPLMLASLFFGAQLILFLFYLRALCAIRKKRGSAGACLPPAILAIAYTVLRLIGWILVYVPAQSSEPISQAAQKAWAWIDIILLWIGNVVFVVFLILYILVVWRVRRVTTK
jgi:hypothetical protein